MPDPRRLDCPTCGIKPPGLATHITTSQTRYWLDLECASCGAQWRADRASGRLITRLAHDHGAH